MTRGRPAILRWWPALVVALLLAAVGVTVLRTRRSAAKPASSFTLSLDPGTAMSGPAPDFTLTDQYGAPISLHRFRGHVVLLAFNDSECTTVCPLTTTAMVDAKRALGKAGAQVELLGIDANPTATAVSDVRAYSEVHGMMHEWHFLTGSLSELERVWRSYNIAVQIEGGQIDHTPALYVIDPRGRLAKVYLTQMSYSSIEQQGRLLAQEASSLLPGHPSVSSKISFAQIPVVSPTTSISLPREGGGALRLGRGGRPRLLLFFATWDSEVTDLATQLESLGSYQSMAAARHLPELAAIDEGSVEPTASALPQLLQRLRAPLPYPVAIDASGRVADGYGVQDEPWLELVGPTGQILWYRDVSTAGWPTVEVLARQVRSALSRGNGPPTAAAVTAELAGSPPALAAVHEQAGRLLGTTAALSARLRSLRGYPVVVNVWASWCPPCRSEFGLFASASAGFGREIAFLGADTDDSAGDARAFLAAHPVSYPSYQTSSATLGSLAAIVGLPTTIFIDRAGNVVHVHIGQYGSQGTLDEDLDAYALGG